MSAPIENAKRELKKLRRERDKELGQLGEEKHVTLEEPELCYCYIRFSRRGFVSLTVPTQAISN